MNYGVSESENINIFKMSTKLEPKKVEIPLDEVLHKCLKCPFNSDVSDCVFSYQNIWQKLKCCFDLNNRAKILKFQKLSLTTHDSEYDFAIYLQSQLNRR